MPIRYDHATTVVVTRRSRRGQASCFEFCGASRNNSKQSVEGRRPVQLHPWQLFITLGMSDLIKMGQTQQAGTIVQ